jgi:hypothetical protein
MSKGDTTDLIKFVSPFDEEIKSVVFWLRDFVWDLYPKANELIYDNYNALAIGWSVSDKVGHTFCNIAVWRTGRIVHFGFYWGSKIADPEKKLIGKGSQYRYLRVEDKNKFPKTYIKKLLKEAYGYSMSLVKDPNPLPQGLTITKSISPAKRLKKEAEKKKNKSK